LDPRTRETLPHEDFDRYVAQPVTALLRRGIADGTLRHDVAPEVLFQLFGGLLEKFLYLVMRKELGVEQASDTLATIFLDGAANAGGRLA
jgi:TetR/AcrR family transcriptional repressor of mexCD-oprJ operon